MTARSSQRNPLIFAGSPDSHIPFASLSPEPQHGPDQATPTMTPTPTTVNIYIRPAQPEDTSAIVGLIRELADFEQLLHLVEVTPEQLAQTARLAEEERLRNLAAQQQAPQFDQSASSNWNAGYGA